MTDIQKPDFLPEKFWDAQSCSPRVEALAKSYRELETRFAQTHQFPKENISEEDKKRLLKLLGHPDTADAYDLVLPDDFESDSEVNERLHAVGLTPPQLQVVYDLAIEKLKPQIEKAQNEQTVLQHENELKNYFGSLENFQSVAKQIMAFAHRIFPADSVEKLAGNAKGIIGLYEMMQSARDPEIGTHGIQKESDVTEKGLRKMMLDPKYWRQQEPDFVKKIKDGFEKLYPTQF